jgi:hypothetical protein
MPPEHLETSVAEPDLRPLLSRRRDPAPAGRPTPGRAWAGRGAGAVGPLCAALEDRHASVRIAAAQALRDVGNLRAIEPLTRALRACVVARSVRWQLFVGYVLAPLVFLLVFLVWLLAAVASSGGGASGLVDLFKWLGDWYRDRRERGRPAGALAEALAAIAERNPAPELRRLIPELQALSMDRLQQERGTRMLSARAARRIGDLTEKLQHLPIPAPASDSASLPLPGQPVTRREL